MLIEFKGLAGINTRLQVQPHMRMVLIGVIQRLLLRSTCVPVVLEYHVFNQLTLILMNFYVPATMNMYSIKQRIAIVHLWKTEMEMFSHFCQ